jgi:hypothetical protein
VASPSALVGAIPSRTQVEASQAALGARVQRVQAELARLVEHFAVSGSGAVASAITRRERELEQLQQQLTALDHAPQLSSGRTSRIEALAQEKIAEFTAVMRRQTPVARQLLGLVLRDRVRFTPHRQAGRAGFRWDADAHLWPVFAGIVSAGSAGVASPTGQSINYQPLFRGSWRSTRRAA